MIPGATLALAAITQQVSAETFEHPVTDCSVCTDMVYTTFFNWLTKQRRELEGLRRERSTR